MSDEATTTVPAVKPARRKRNGNGRRARSFDPVVAEIRDAAKQRVAEYRANEVSQRLLRRILEKDLGRMNPGDQERLEYTLETGSKERRSAAFEAMSEAEKLAAQTFEPPAAVGPCQSRAALGPV